MSRYIVQRLLATIPTLLLLIFAIVLFARVTPTNVIDVILQGQTSNANTNETRHQLEARLGIDKPLPVTYIEYIGNALRGDIGESLLNGTPVRDLVADRLPVTIELALFGLILGWLVGSIAGIISAVKQNSATDYAFRFVAIIGLTVPNFAIGTAIVVLPAVYWHWQPSLIYKPFVDDPISNIGEFTLPAITLAVALSGTVMRIMRTQMLEVLRQDYIRTARVKGLKESRIIWRHALKNAMIPVISLFGLQMGVIVGGTVIIEQIFSLPGMGTLLLNAVNQKDWPIVQGITLLFGVWIIIINLLVDLSYVVFDPRTKVGGS
jgi:peptide/nickel transport system permease protein